MASPPTPGSFFRSHPQEPSTLDATALCRGPWDPGACHGGPPAALLARAVERFGADDAMFVCRLTYEILRPVPLGELTVRTRSLRPGRRVQLIEATIAAGDQDVMRATALRIRRSPADLAVSSGNEEGSAPTADLLAPDAAPQMRWLTDEVGIGEGIELRSIHGSFFETGPAAAWFRLRTPLVDDEVPTALQRAALVADFGNGLGRVLDIERYWFINPDLTLSMHRHPVGEWLALDAVTQLEPGAGARSEGLLSDERGPFGRAIQHLWVAER
jgi:hypothetical protein